MIWKMRRLRWNPRYTQRRNVCNHFFVVHILISRKPRTLPLCLLSPLIIYVAAPRRAVCVMLSPAIVGVYCFSAKEVWVSLHPSSPSERSGSTALLCENDLTTTSTTTLIMACFSVLVLNLSADVVRYSWSPRAAILRRTRYGYKVLVPGTGMYEYSFVHRVSVYRWSLAMQVMAMPDY